MRLPTAAASVRAKLYQIFRFAIGKHYYVGPNPAINAWQKSSGKAIKIISGAASGGAALVVKSGISSVSQLKGQKLATPSLGNTQDVALRYWLKQHGLTTSPTGGGPPVATTIAASVVPSRRTVT